MSLRYSNVLVAVDGSKEAERAFNKSVSIAKRNDANLIIGHIVDTKTYATVEAYDGTIVERAERYAEEFLEEYKTEAIDSGIKNVKTVIEFGSPKVRISRELAPKHEVDLIICGAQGLNAVERFFLGSVSEHITRYAKCDVLIVRNEAEAEAE
ncbi:universal stress protein [Bacillus solimangrovi]|uniref:Universal stress protein n=1 Tax=Bacillus solimangrovi TaxID=1305675 RepID=A0A1E5LCP4_9BACI|nr:universal stress protein [Bacillus solimangrovi]OEH91840.1 universal stress protein UspA [Bacillus solimangrovi]